MSSIVGPEQDPTDFQKSEETSAPEKVKELEPLPRPSKQEAVREFIKDTLILVGTTLVIAFILQAFVIKVFHVPSPSMRSTLEVNDRILVSLMYPEIGGIHRGDIVVFKDPGGWLEPGTDGEHIVKRVIGLPGDTVACCNDFGQIEVNGEGIDEDYVMEDVNPSDIEFSEVVPEGMLWVMGDNRPTSLDSRFHAATPNGKFVPIDSVVGQAVARFWPFDRFQVLHD